MACAKIDTPADTKIWFRTNWEVSKAISASRIRDSAAVMFSPATSRFETAASIRFCNDPILARADATELIALSILDSAASAAWEVEKCRADNSQTSLGANLSNVGKAVRRGANDPFRPGIYKTDIEA